MKKTTIFLLLLCSSLLINAQEHEIPKGFWKIPKTAAILKIGGYVKMDAIHDFDRIGSPYFFDVSKIATDGSNGEATTFNARESRLKFDLRIPNQHLRTYIEGDFYGVNGAFRLRHAYLEYKGWLAGQTWSNFMDENIIPPTLDFEKPLAYAFARHALIRYKFKVTKDAYIALALEQASSKGQAPVGTGRFETPLPDFTARYRVTKNWGHIQLSTYLASVRYQFDTGKRDDVTQFGGNLSGQFNFAQHSKIFAQLMYGNGITRYRGASSVGLDAHGNLASIKELGFTIGVHHAWNQKVKSLIVYNHGDLDNTAGQQATDIAKTYYFAVNTTYNITPTTMVGLEYLGGRRENINGTKGDASRLQFSFKQSINM